MGDGLATPAVLQADAERRRIARPAAGLDSGRGDQEQGSGRQSSGVPGFSEDLSLAGERSNVVRLGRGGTCSRHPLHAATLTGPCTRLSSAPST